MASAFSQFAQMPAARPERLDLREEVVRAAVEWCSTPPPARSIVVHDAPGAHRGGRPRAHASRAEQPAEERAVWQHPEGREGRIEVSARKVDDRAVLRSATTGADPCRGARSASSPPASPLKSSGMGLGLAPVKRMVEQAGGRVWFESAEGEGARFVVELLVHRQAGTFGLVIPARPIAP
ncbi:MAG: sensor histidine kinase [Flavobacteriales bacterium]|nr:sensor histidine kinase [Flavobacteriales bacterium]